MWRPLTHTRGVTRFWCSIKRRTNTNQSLGSLLALFVLSSRTQAAIGPNTFAESHQTGQSNYPDESVPALATLPAGAFHLAEEAPRGRGCLALMTQRIAENNIRTLYERSGVSGVYRPTQMCGINALSVASVYICRNVECGDNC